MDVIIATFNDPKVTPGVKKCVIEWLDRFILLTYIDPLRDVQDQLCAAVTKVADDKDAPCREAGMHALGTLLGRLGAPALSKYVDGLIPAKKGKVEEAAKEVKPTKYDKSAKDEAKKAAAAQKAAAASAKAAPAKKPTPAKKAAAAGPSEDEMMGGGGDEEAMMDFGGPPKKKPAGPPSRLAKKAAAPGAGGDEEMKTGEQPPAQAPKPKAEASGPPRAFGQKPPGAGSAKPKAAAGGGKAASAPVVEDEPLGEGLSKEECE